MTSTPSLESHQNLYLVGCVVSRVTSVWKVEKIGMECERVEFYKHPVTCFLACLVYFSLSFKYLSTPAESINISSGIVGHLWFHKAFCRK